jgi:hypothetical protein
MPQNWTTRGTASFSTFRRHQGQCRQHLYSGIRHLSPVPYRGIPIPDRVPLSRYLSHLFSFKNWTDLMPNSLALKKIALEIWLAKNKVWQAGRCKKLRDGWLALYVRSTVWGTVKKHGTGIPIFIFFLFDDRLPDYKPTRSNRNLRLSAIIAS